VAQHYAFWIGEPDFDRVFERIRERGVPYWSDPHKEHLGEIYRHDGGRGLYFDDPDGHLLEVLTRPYGSGTPGALPAGAGPLRAVGVVRSQLTRRKDAPKQGSEGAPDAWVEIDPAFREALDGIAAGSEVILLTWLHLGDRAVLRVRPRRDPKNPITGVFATRSPDRPNPIGLHRVRVLEIADATRLRVEPLEVVDGTPVLDVKPVLPGVADA
jgi:tRNA-Thr(GGU) m(6)t(6)A37 methyltransferase TsaA